ncbi:MAG: HDOD domain-containing protein [Granulosicoccus sp.]
MPQIVLLDTPGDERSMISEGILELRPDWCVRESWSAAQTLQLLEEQPADCLVCQAVISDIDLLALYDRLKKQFPNMIRFAFSSEPRQELVLESATTNQRIFNRDEPLNELVEGIESSLRLHGLLSDYKKNIQHDFIQSLPALPTIYNDMMRELAVPHASLLTVGQIIESDSALTAMVLKLVNSAFYGLSQPVDSVGQAVSLLGVHLIKNLAMTAKVFSLFEGSTSNLRKLERLNADACFIAALTNQFARLAELPRSTVDHCQIAGMLCNIGSMIALERKNASVSETDQASTALGGACLLQAWGMPDSVIEAVALQHGPSSKYCSTTSPVVVLHAVRFLQNNYRYADDRTQSRRCVDYLTQMAHLSVVEQWLKAYETMIQLTGEPIMIRTSHSA